MLSCVTRAHIGIYIFIPCSVPLTDLSPPVLIHNALVTMAFWSAMMSDKVRPPLLLLFFLFLFTSGHLFLHVCFKPFLSYEVIKSAGTKNMSYHSIRRQRNRLCWWRVETGKGNERDFWGAGCVPFLYKHISDLGVFLIGAPFCMYIILQIETYLQLKKPAGIIIGTVLHLLFLRE